MFKKFEQCKKTVYNDVSLPAGPPKESERYKREVELTARQRARVLRARIPNLDDAENSEKKARFEISTDVVVLITILVIAILLPWSYKVITILPLLFVTMEIWLNNRENRIILLPHERSESPNFDLEKEVEKDIHREAGIRD